MVFISAFYIVTGLFVNHLKGFLWFTDCLTIGIIHETMVVHMTWDWTFFNNYIYIYVYIYAFFLSGHWDGAGRWRPVTSKIARFLGPTWGPSGADRTQVGPMLAPWTLLSGLFTSHGQCQGVDIVFPESAPEGLIEGKHVLDWTFPFDKWLQFKIALMCVSWGQCSTSQCTGIHVAMAIGKFGDWT